jgi:putative photosynthetic complex assembly protein 2
VSVYLAPVAYALFLWWFATGAILFLDGLPRRTYAASMTGAAIVLIGGFVGVAASAGMATASGAFLAFTSALAVWAFIEMSFLMGYVTGPRRHACQSGCSGLRHMRHAVEAILWHELLIIACALVIAAMTWQAANMVAFWTFAILAGMRASAKLNLHFGVRNLADGLLPPHLAYLKSFLRKRSMNGLFPVSVTAATVLCAWVAIALHGAAGPFEIAGLALLLTLLVLGLIEHWFLVLPLPVEEMWAWSRRTGDTTAKVQPALAPAKLTTGE